MNISQGHSLPQILHLGLHETSTGLALFYVCYVIFDLPSNLIMSRVSPRVWMSRIVFCTGIIGTCMAGVRSVWSFYLLRLLLGIVIAGMWPGMTYYLTLYYPPARIGKRIGYYFTAAQVSAAVVGLVSAVFQLMDGAGGLYGWQWMFLFYGIVGIIIGISLLWWLPDRPLPPGTLPSLRTKWYHHLSPHARPALTGFNAEVHYRDLEKVYHARPWNFRDLFAVLKDWRLWPLIIMYFGVVGVGIGIQNYGTVIILSIQPGSSGVKLSLLFAPIWIVSSTPHSPSLTFSEKSSLSPPLLKPNKIIFQCDLIAILLVTPISDRYPSHLGRALFFAGPVLFQVTGLLLTTFAPFSALRYVGLLFIGFGLGPTVPILMAWTSQIFQARHSQVGVAAASALVSGLGNLGSILTVYGLYVGWEDDYYGYVPGFRGRKFGASNIVMIAILGASLLAAAGLVVGLQRTEARDARSANRRFQETPVRE